MDDLHDKVQKLIKYIKKDLPEDVGVEAVNHFSESFQNEGFTDKKLKKWEPALRKSDPKVKGARKSRKTLTGDTGDLGNSIKYEVKKSEIKITSDKKYATIHNEGGKAGRGLKTKIPQRQFVGPSQALNKKIEDMITTNINRIFNK